MTCGAPDQSVALPAGIDLSKQSVLTGKVLAGAEPVGGAFVRLLDGTGEFTAEVVTSRQGDFRFYAAPGTWTLRALSALGQRRGRGEGRRPRPAPDGAGGRLTAGCN